MYRLVNDEVKKSDVTNVGDGDSIGMRELRAHLYRLQRLMLALLPKFQPLSLSDANDSRFRVQIAANIMLYVRNQMQHSKMDQKLHSVLFEPYLSQQPDKQDIQMREAPCGMHLGVVVELLVSAVDLLQYELSQKKMTSMKEMSLSDFKKVFVCSSMKKKVE